MARKKKIERSDVMFLPDHLSQVKAIAMRGLTDQEMAEVFGIKKGLIEKWKEFYPSFNKAIEEGRTEADIKVVQALFEKATGYSHNEEKIHFDKGGKVHTYDTIKQYPPDMAAIKMWMTNRQKEHWTDSTEHRMGGTKDGEPIGVRDETKSEIVNSILGLIKPKSDDPDE